MEIKRCYDTIIGASVGENQLVQSGATSVTVQSGHKYYAKINGTESLGASTGSAITINDSAKDMVTDLTQKLGSAIADYVYGLGTSSGIAKLREWGFLRGYQEFNTGSIESVEVTGKVVRGFNQWDEECENGVIYSDGREGTDSNSIRSKNYCLCKPNTTYYGKSPSSFLICWYDGNKQIISRSDATNKTATSPSSATYFRITCVSYGNTYNNDICINLSSSRNGEYEAYSAQEYDYGDDTLRGIFKLDANNNLYADGDTKTSDGTITRKYKKIVIDEDADISTGASGMPFRFKITDKKQNTSTSDLPNAIADKLQVITQASTWGIPFTFSFPLNQEWMYFKLSDSITTIEDAKTWLASNPITLVYELATPTTEQGDPFASPQVCYPDGTEEYITGNGVPVGHETRYEL